MGFNNVDVKVGSAASVINALQDYNTVILKPNIVDNRNVLTQSMMSEKHTKYVIRWNYILEGGTVTVPEDCIIEFAGGTIDNGVIVGNNTRLIYSKPIDGICKAERQGTWIYDTTVADEEDITSVEGHLKFKDRPATDGMGKVILRKNKSFASQVTEPNTIYVIQYDFILDSDITIPENCVLEFDGGSIKNHKITFNHTTIQCKHNTIFSNIEFGGTIANEFNASWACDNTGTEDVTLVLNNIIKLCSDSRVRLFLPYGTYNISAPIELWSSSFIYGESKSSTSSGSTLNWIGGTYTNELPTDSSKDMLTKAEYSTNRRIDGAIVQCLMFEGNKKARNGLNLSGFMNSKFSSIFVREVKHSYIYGHSALFGHWTTPMVNNFIEDFQGWSSLVNNEFDCKYGIRLCSACNTNYFVHCAVKNIETGISLEDNITQEDSYDATFNEPNNNNVFKACYIEPSKHSIFVNSENNLFSGCRCEGNEYVVFYPTEKSEKLRNNTFTNLAIYSNSIAFTNDTTVNDIYINCGPNKIEGISAKRVNSPLIQHDNIVSIKAGSLHNLEIRHNGIVFLNNDTHAFLVKSYSNSNNTIKTQLYDNVNFYDVEKININTKNIVKDLPVKLASFTEETIKNNNSYYDYGFMFCLNNRPHVIYNKNLCAILTGESGLTTSRPTYSSTTKGQIFFDTTLGKPIWWNGTAWVDATGATV